MSPLTKAFVILVTILSIVLVALVIPFVARTENYQGRLQTLGQQVQAATLAAQQSQQDLQALTDELDVRQRQFISERNALNSKITGLQSQLQQEQSTSQTAQAKLAQFQASLTQFASAADQDAALLKTLREELSQSRDNLVDVRGKNVQLADRAVELQSEMQAFQRQVRQLKENMVQMQQQLVSVRNAAQQLTGPAKDQIASALAGQTPQANPTAPSVQGKVTQVQKVDGTTLVQVDLGSSDGLEEGNQFMVARGGQFLGTLQIVKVQPRQSAGRMILTQGPIQQGDQVIGGQF